VGRDPLFGDAQGKPSAAERDSKANRAASLRMTIQADGLPRQSDSAGKVQRSFGPAKSAALRMTGSGGTSVRRDQRFDRSALQQVPGFFVFFVLGVIRVRG
jgi:hypothetical protein